MAGLSSIGKMGRGQSGTGLPAIHPIQSAFLPAMRPSPVALYRTYLGWIRRLPEATTTIFAARSRWGRSCKMALFGVGVVLPLGSLIWAALFWHGSTLRKP